MYNPVHNSMVRKKIQVEKNYGFKITLCSEFEKCIQNFDIFVNNEKY